jgi:signal transduction histidine kinase
MGHYSEAEVIRFTRPPSGLWLAYLAAGFAAIGLYYLLPRGSSGQGFLYDAIGMSSALVVVAGTLLHRPARPLPWYLFAAGLLAFAIGDTIFNVYAYVWHRDPPLPSVADVFYLSGYPFLAAGLAVLITHLDARRRLAGLIDAAIFAVGFALVQWVFLMDDVVHGEGSIAFRAVSISYPAMDIVLMGALAFFFLSPGWRTVAYRFIGVSIVLQLVADEIYATSPNSYVSATWLDAGWLLSYVIWGAAALHPSMRTLSKPRERHLPHLHPARIAFLGAALLTAPAVIVIQRATDAHIDAVPIALAGAILPMLVPVRLAVLVRGLDRLRRDERVARAEAEFAQRLLAEQNERLRESDRLKDEFVALISHDLRTPLTSIMGYLELALDDEELGEEPRTYLDVVQRNSERLLRLVNDLLFVARLEAGELDLHSSEVDLGACVRQAVEEARPRAAAKSIELGAEVQSVPELRADRGRMFQLLDNLISNAIKFTPEGGRIEVRLTQRDSRLRLEVSDTGIGIAQEELSRLFERFFRATTATERHIPGTGLGLYIAGAIVGAHGGEIDVESTPGQGTTFCVEFPVVMSGAEQRELVG